MSTARTIAVIGAGWAGLAAAVAATSRGHAVSLFEMARAAGGRARAVDARLGEFDNGQHILIGAYSRTLALMRHVGVDPERVLWRAPLRLQYPDGRGLALPTGAPVAAFARGVLAAQGWSLIERLRLMAVATGWLMRGFRCPPEATVETLCRGLPAPVLRDLIEPLCVAALNTPMGSASAAVFMRVMQDALFCGPGSADLLLPKVSMSELLPRPAIRWLGERGTSIALGRRVLHLEAMPDGWSVDGEVFDAVVLACSAVEAARLCAGFAPDWSRMAAALRHEPIVTAYLHDERLRLPFPMLALRADVHSPAQFAFDLGQLGRTPGLFAFVASGAACWVERGLAETGRAALQQARSAFPGAFVGPDDEVLRHIAAEQRATFACTPALERPPAQIAPGVWAAGDYVEGPYPATLEGAVRAGEHAIDRASAMLASNHMVERRFAMQK